ncbi:flagellar motor switch phosphatase FliY [Anaeroselena agilis]|uniref:Flagellar motor switch phosphatase FliY n=1 Tax=Anaeroselena agilis TaxID=3063788 RepID=A0ABU3NWV9_9FIRM|nr:flagellar motor switch phosphatase FliY [Selenomonadales bacterium 4137-cl]
MNNGFLSQEEIDALLRGEPVASGEGDLSDIEKDAMGEIGNISMGSAATTLSILLSRRVSITTPKVRISSINEIKKQYPLPYLVIEVGYTHGLTGSNILAIREQDALIISDLMMGGDGTNPPAELNELYMSAVSEAMNQMMGSVATSMSTVFKKKIDIAPPACNLLDFSGDANITSVTSPDEPMVEVSFRMEVEDLIDSEIMQLVSLDVAKEMVSNLIGVVEANAAPQPAAAPAPAAPPSPQPMPVAAAPSQQPMPQPTPQPMMPPPQTMVAMPAASAAVPPNVVVQPVQFAPLKPTMLPVTDTNIGLILDVPLQVTVELGRTRKLIREILELAPGSVVELDKLAGEPVDILVNGKQIAKGEVVVIDENFGVRVTEIIGQLDRTTLQ